MQILFGKPRWQWVGLAFMPGLYALIVVYTLLISFDVPGGVFYRIIGLNPLAGMFMMVGGSTQSIVTVFLATGIPWWFIVGLTGWRQLIARHEWIKWGFGVVVPIGVLVICAGFIVPTIQNDINGGLLNQQAYVQYSMIALLCLVTLTNLIRNVLSRNNDVKS